VPAADAACAAILALAALAIAWHAGVKGFGAVPDVARGLAAVLVLTVVCGYAPARLLLPRELAPHFALFVPLVGCAVAGLALSALGFAGVPFVASIAVVLATGVAAGGLARARLGPARADPVEVRRCGGRLYTLGWPGYLAVLLTAILLAPIFQAGFATVPGVNPDGMLGVGVAELLQTTHPRGSDVDLPVDTMPLVWRSKYPIYYVLAGTATLSGLEPIKVFAAESAFLAALAAIAFMLMARHGLQAGPRAGVLVMAVVGLDALMAHLAGHPYHNQLWGALALPLILLFGMRFIGARARRDAALLALFATLGVSAYPLMVAFPALALGAAALVTRHRRGRFSPRIRRPRAARSAAMGVALVLVAVPAVLVLGEGVLEKAGSAAELLVSGGSLGPWRGDLRSYKPPGFFVGVPGAWGYAAAALVAVAAALGLRRAPRAWGVALGAVAAGALAFALLFRVREFGEYFHFKVLAFLAPLALTTGAVWVGRSAGGPGRGARAALVGGALFLCVQVVGLAGEVAATGQQLDRSLLGLREASADLPRGASVRIDVAEGGPQLWSAYMLAGHPLSASAPVVGTTFPHAPAGRKADYILADGRVALDPWPDAVGPPVFDNGDYRIYRMRPDVPGPDVSSKRLVDSLSPAFE